MQLGAILQTQGNIGFCFVFQASFWSTALKTLISVSTVILLGLIFAYHALEVQVRKTQDMHGYTRAQLHIYINRNNSGTRQRRAGTLNVVSH